MSAESTPPGYRGCHDDPEGTDFGAGGIPNLDEFAQKFGMVPATEEELNDESCLVCTSDGEVYHLGDLIGALVSAVLRLTAEDV